MSVELFAVNAVSDRIAASPRLSPEIPIGDKTPITDGHIDFYNSADKSKQTHGGRVPVQVKGRVVGAKIKASRKSQSFSVEREVLRFFRNHGGGVYFYVPMQKEGGARPVFYAILLPFKIDRLLGAKAEAQKTFTVKMTRLPDDPAKVEGIIRLAWNGRTQLSTTGGNGHLIEQAEQLTIHSLAGFDHSKPTRLALGETDYVVVAHLAGGIEVPIDVDLDVLPHDYIERPVAVPISCGGVEFTDGTGRRVDEKTIRVNLSAGLEMRLKTKPKVLKTNLRLTLEGSFQDQAKNMDFVLAAASGKPLIIGQTLQEPRPAEAQLEGELKNARSELSRMIKLFDEFDIRDDFTSQINLDHKTRQMFLALHTGVVEDLPVRGNSDGTGRYDIPVGEYKIMVIVMPAEESGFRRIIDPFDPSKRDRFRIYRLTDDGPPEPIVWGTAYESVSTEDLALILNLRLKNLVDAYAALEDQDAASSQANQMVLRLLAASDRTTAKHHRENLLTGAADLSAWLCAHEPNSLVHRINAWQTAHRQGNLDETDRRNIRAARRTLNTSEAQAGLLEACMLILLGDTEELELALAELDPEEVEQLKGWPISALTIVTEQAQ